MSGAVGKRVWWHLTLTILFLNFPSFVIGSVACAITHPSSSSAVIYTTSSVILCVFGSIFLYGVSTNPYSFITANVESAEINPT